MRIKCLIATVLVSNLALAATPIEGWYSSLFGGYNYLPGNVSAYNEGYLFNHTSYLGGYNAGARFGYQSNPLRYEIEYTYMHAQPRNYDFAAIPQTYIDGFAQANLLMGNIYYDFREILASISPYLSLGIGYADLQIDLGSEGPTTGTHFHARANELAYQGSAGLTFNFAENYAINIAYRYLATEQASAFGKVFQAHIANAGVVYRFDQAKYK